MLITLLTILFSLFMVYLVPTMVQLEPAHLAPILLVGGTSIFFGTVLLNLFILTPFQKLEVKLCPNLMEILRKDSPLKWGRLYLFFFVLVTYVCVAFAFRVEELRFHWFLLVWLILFAAAIDVLRDSWRRLVNLMNPLFLISKTAKLAETAIQNDNREMFLNELGNLSEIAVLAVENCKLSLSTRTLQTFPPLIKIHFDSAKSISHISQDIKDKQKGDDTNYFIFYILQHFELIFDKAVRDRQETVCRQMIMSLGKIIIHCAQFDLSMVAFPTHFLTKFGLKAQQHYFEEVTVLTTGTLLEIARTILTEIDLTYAELQEPFQTIINGLTAIARSTFKKNKETSIKVLMQPLVDLKELFKSEKMANHRDTPAIVQQINNVLDEFSLLEQVMQTIPPMTIASEDQS